MRLESYSGCGRCNLTDINADEAKGTTTELLKPARLKSSIGTSVLHCLNSILAIHKLDHEVQVEVITALAAFTRRADPWTTEQALHQASSLLNTYKSSAAAVCKAKDGSLVPLLGDMLKNVVKPAFARTKTQAITPAGRRAEHPIPAPRLDPSLFDEGSKPWKYKDVYVATVLGWIVEQYRVCLQLHTYPLFKFLFANFP